MERRKFITGLGIAAALPFAARAQQAMPVIGYFNSGKATTQIANVTKFRAGLTERGVVEGENATIEFHWGENHFDKLAELAAEVVARHPAVIVSNTLAARAAKAATTSIPIVFTTGSDPIRERLVTSLSRPGGNVTGVVFITGVLGAKRLELLREVLPKATTIAFLFYPNTPETEAERKDVQAAAKAMGREILFLDVHSVSDIDQAFATMVARDVGALLAGTGPFMFNNYNYVVAQAIRHGIATMGSTREYAQAGSLMSYGASITEAFHQAGLYAARLLKGEKPGDLPVFQSSKFEFIINLRTAKILGLEFHPQLLATADEVIE
jgi:putative ABC transport system substrate-binding protein